LRAEDFVLDNFPVGFEFMFIARIVGEALKDFSGLEVVTGVKEV
jgi:hypothetical protein